MKIGIFVDARKYSFPSGRRSWKLDDIFQQKGLAFVWLFVGLFVF